MVFHESFDFIFHAFDIIHRFEDFCDREHPSRNSDALDLIPLIIVSKFLDVHWSWSYDDFEILSFRQDHFDSPQDHINTESPFMSLVDYEARIVLQEAVSGHFI